MRKKLLQLCDVFPGLAQTEWPEVGVEGLVNEILHNPRRYLIDAKVHGVLEVLGVVRIRDPEEVV